MFMIRPKKIHTRNFMTKKKLPAAKKFPTPPPRPPPNNFPKGPSLKYSFALFIFISFFKWAVSSATKFATLLHSIMLFTFTFN